jgi:hypothetical protein
MQKTRKGFFDTEEGKEIKRKLQQMTRDSTYNTTSSYSTNSLLYSDNLIPFVDKHMNYLINHPSLEAKKYLANIRLITRVR